MRTILLPLLALLSGCAAAPATVDAVPVAPGVTLRLPEAAELGRSVDAAQLVTARHGEDVFVFEGRLSASPEGLVMVGTDPLGRRAMTIRWAQGRMAVERAAWLPDGVRPENVLADIVLLYWPGAALRQALAASGAVVEDGPQRRSVRLDGRELIAVSYEDGDRWNGTARLDNLSWGYQIEVRSLAVAP
ncbi:MAG: DUF3261 domain-containing protein [Solirubrobacterales bacterium]